MSMKIRVSTFAVAATLLLGTTTFAGEPRRGHRAALEEGQGFAGQLFEWVRQLIAERRDRPEQAPPAPGAWQKDGSHLDPNGCTANCPK